VDGDEDAVMLSALQHFAYCPRQCGLIHIEQVWDDNLYTLRGDRGHRAVDIPQGMVREGVRVERALPIWCRRLGLVGRADVVEFEADGMPYPVEHKIGRKKVSLADEVQLCGQALCLEEMFGIPIPCGALFYRASMRRREVVFTSQLRMEVERIASEVRALIRDRRLSEPLADERCPDCSLIDTCTPFVPRDRESLMRLLEEEP
jgi:CRISPR-associated exonuclease Cas4